MTVDERGQRAAVDAKNACDRAMGNLLSQQPPG